MSSGEGFSDYRSRDHDEYLGYLDCRDHLGRGLDRGHGSLVRRRGCDHGNRLLILNDLFTHEKDGVGCASVDTKSFVVHLELCPLKRY